MPARYEEIRDSLVSRGMSLKRAKKVAAIKYNKTRKEGEAPVTRNYEKTKAKMTKKSTKKKSSFSKQMRKVNKIMYG